MEFGVFYLPAIGNKSELQEGMAGRRTDLYQRMLRDLAEQAQYLDAHGYYGIGFTEHHFHIEGEEVSTNPILLDMYLGMQTENIRLGQLGLVLPCQNPIRVAEDIAILDQVTKGRMMYLSLTFDHRIVDGAFAAEFLQKVKGYLEDPWWMVS